MLNQRSGVGTYYGGFKRIIITCRHNRRKLPIRARSPANRAGSAENTAGAVVKNLSQNFASRLRRFPLAVRTVTVLRDIISLPVLASRDLRLAQQPQLTRM
jgi:hypothetical protein